MDAIGQSEDGNPFRVSGDREKCMTMANIDDDLDDDNKDDDDIDDDDKATTRCQLG